MAKTPRYLSWSKVDVSTPLSGAVAFMSPYGHEATAPFRVVETSTLDQDRHLGVFAIADHESGLQS